MIIQKLLMLGMRTLIGIGRRNYQNIMMIDSIECGSISFCRFLGALKRDTTSFGKSYLVRKELSEVIPRVDDYIFYRL